MSSVLLIFAGLGIVAVAIAVYVFTVAARNYVSDPAAERESRDNEMSAEQVFIERSGRDRRQAGNVIQFPIKLPSGEIVLHERRMGDRRVVS